jgi:hypothetical protein
MHQAIGIPATSPANRYHSMRMPHIRFRLLTLMMLMAVIAVGLLAIRTINSRPELGRGSAEHAAKWQAIFEDLSDPELVKTRYPFAAAKRYADGSWIFGVSYDSHGARDGGTIVVKDSTGKVRAFFGHVCGPDLLQDEVTRSSSLAEFYSNLSQSQFKFAEYAFP